MAAISRVFSHYDNPEEETSDEEKNIVYLSSVELAAVIDNRRQYDGEKCQNNSPLERLLVTTGC